MKVYKIVIITNGVTKYWGGNIYKQYHKETDGKVYTTFARAKAGAKLAKSHCKGSEIRIVEYDAVTNQYFSSLNNWEPE